MSDILEGAILPPETRSAGTVVLVNTFHPKPGLLDEFIAMQVAESRRLGRIARSMGWLGNRIHRARDGGMAVIVTAFASEEAHRHWAATEEFADHLERIAPLLERVESKALTLVASNGVI